VLAPNPDGVPVYLTNLARWLLWRKEQRVNRKTGEISTTKPPISYHTSKHCNVTDPRSWASFDKVMAALGNSAAWDGVGFALGDLPEYEEILIGLDLDNCLDEDGALADWAMDFLVAMASYAEVSPSGTGIKCIARIRRVDFALTSKLLDVPEGDRDQARTRIFGQRTNGRHAPGAQLFLGGRYFTITGQHWVASPEDVTVLSIGQVAQLAHLFGARSASRTASPGQRRANDETEPEEAQIRDKLGHAFMANPRLGERWEGGIAGLSDTTRSGFDMSIVSMLKAAGFSYGETRVASRLFEHGKLADEEDAGRGDRYFARMWERSSAIPPPVPPRDWEEEHPPVDKIPPGEDGRRRSGRSREPPQQPLDLSTVWDPWDEPSPPEWPNGILSPEAEDTLALISLRDGIDLGLLCSTVVAGVSAAASKATRFFPYRHGGWSQPPIWWLMAVGDSGVRKSYLDHIGFAPIRATIGRLWALYKMDLRTWESEPKQERGPKPEEPPDFIFNDFTVEAMQDAQEASGRGTAVVTDELVTMLEFDRYHQKGNVSAARGFCLTAYDDAPYPVRRRSKDRKYNLEHSGFSVFGGIQPGRLGDFRAEMEKDGLFQRFTKLLVAPAGQARPDINIGNGLTALHAAIERLCYFDARLYHTTEEGTQIIRDTKVDAQRLATTITDFGPGWAGWCYKLHGTEARLALLLHLLEQPEADIIPTDTVLRAHRLVHRFILQHAAAFHDTIASSNRTIHRDIAGWLLTRDSADPSSTELERITASDLTHNVWSSRDLGSKRIGEVLDRLIIGGWLTPEHDYPGCRAWFFKPAIRSKFADRQRAERERRAEFHAVLGRLKRNRQV
jgi:hypothetical protein